MTGKLYLSEKLIADLKTTNTNESNLFQLSINKLKEIYELTTIVEENLSKKEENYYHHYNGYLKIGENIKSYISFTQYSGAKKGNTVIIQDNMPFIINKLRDEPLFASDKTVDKILFLTSDINDGNKVNKKKPDSFQVAVTTMEVLGYDVFPLVEYEGLKLLDSVQNFSVNNYLNIIRKLSGKSNNKIRLYYKYYDKDKVFKAQKIDDEIKEGQFIKFYLFRMLPLIIMLFNNQEYKVDLSNLKSEKYPFTLLSTVASNYKVESELTIDIEDPMQLEVDEKIDDTLTNDTSRPIKSIKTKEGKKWKTNRKIKDAKIREANYMCLICGNNKNYFTSESTSENYVEGHHVIPMNLQGKYIQDFASEINLDVKDNIISLCADCHRKIHLANKEGKEQVIQIIWNKEKDNLKNVDNEITLERLKSIYGIR